jgi:hypothetical protein
MFSTGAESEKFCEIAFLVLLREFFYGNAVLEKDSMAIFP